MSVRVQTEDFDPGAETNAFLAAAEGAGASVTFTGLVRSSRNEPVTELTLECYPELARNEIADLRQQAIERFSLIGAAIIHRYGTMLPGQPIVQVMTLASHRQAAFEGAEFLMDYLKTEAPFWKKQSTADGEQWVESRSEDDAARRRWERAE